MNVDEMKRLAAIMNPGRKVMVDVLGSVKTYMPGEEPGICKDLTEFNPSLTGSDWQQAQALQCIVAAFKLPWFLCLEIYGDDFVISIKEHGRIHTSHGADILTAACLALLASTPSAVENVNE